MRACCRHVADVSENNKKKVFMFGSWHRVNCNLMNVYPSVAWVAIGDVISQGQTKISYALLVSST